MQAFQIHRGTLIPLDRANVDTDAIIPKQFLKSVKRSGFGAYLFDEWRFLDHGEPGMRPEDRPENPDFILNQAPYRQGSILLARRNFGCGSSREHAVWAIEDYGIRAVLAPSFADIFYNNCFKNGVLPIVLNEAQIDLLFARAEKEILQAEIDLSAQELRIGKDVFLFEIDAFRKECMLQGLDQIALTLQHAGAIRDYEKRYFYTHPWLE